MTRRFLALIAFCLVLGACVPVRAAKPKVTIGSKAFPESWVLGEALTDLVRQSGSAEVEHKSNMGGTEIVYRGLLGGSIDAYPEYTGTISEVLMKSPGRPGPEEIRRFLAQQGVGMTDSLGFNDGYALAVMPATADRLGLKSISDLGKHPELRLGFTHEFVGRKDGWAGLAAHYRLHMTDVRGMEHQLAYGALAGGQIDVMEIYTTDAKIGKLGLRVLDDDRRFFPRYDAVVLYRLDLPTRAPAAFAAMQRLQGRIDEAHMIRANGMVELEKRSQKEAAAALLHEVLGGSQPISVVAESRWQEIGTYTLRHLELVGISLLAAVIVGIPVGILATQSRALAAIALSGTGLLQTIPSLALLAFLVPRFGTTITTALIALFLYSLLPIVRNTYTGLATIPPGLAESAEALGLSPAAQLLRVRLPMASPAIMAGIKTSAVINVGTATLAALIGAGGLGEPILRGISLLDRGLILEGAIPAAVLALLVQGGFDLLDRIVIPRGLRLPASREG